jgi:hypothetical protein
MVKPPAKKRKVSQQRGFFTPKSMLGPSTKTNGRFNAKEFLDLEKSSDCGEVVCDWLGCVVRQ